jgi:cytochrome c5
VRRALLTAAWAGWAVASAAQSRQPDTLALDAGVYAAHQATRGKAHYDAFCASCHAGDLSGTLAADSGAPPLRGAPFVASMEKKGIAAVFDYLKTTMPADDPASLKDSEYVEILAFLIDANGFPAGTRDLTAADLPRLRVRRPGVP